MMDLVIFINDRIKLKRTDLKVMGFNQNNLTEEINRLDEDTEYRNYFFAGLAAELEEYEFVEKQNRLAEKQNHQVERWVNHFPEYRIDHTGYTEINGVAQQEVVLI